jgi:hypothetical protein
MRFIPLMLLLSLGTYAMAGDHVMNTTCPISGKPVDPTVKTTPFNPKTDTAAKATPGGPAYAVGFCCPKCEATYVKDPAKYHDDLEKQKAATK